MNVSSDKQFAEGDKIEMLSADTVIIYRSATRTHAEEIQAIREDIRNLKNIYLGSNVRIVNSIVDGAS
ncbi:hypothetical protein EYZ11_007941 [Aspergillus tanneri]|uniref:Uncharacterized protein n=1 Tax=Aspergillus tanneri TaxID=1220188 RepID=A0A4S3JDX1_9EURO|nr:hypothetical protein EYZ11_007941 [Aspergillus tanneri]